jgi:hypothetical protein
MVFEKNTYEIKVSVSMTSSARGIFGHKGPEVLLRQYCFPVGCAQRVPVGDMVWTIFQYSRLSVYIVAIVALLALGNIKLNTPALLVLLPSSGCEITQKTVTLMPAEQTTVDSAGRR